MMRVGRAGVHLLTAKVGEDALGIARVLCNQPMHFGHRACLTLRRSLVVKGEAQAKQNGALERLAGISGQRCR